MFTLNCRGRLLVVDKPLVMGILNITPDSFFSGSRVVAEDAIIQRAGQMLADGAAILDLGGQSTRPGSNKLDAETEAARVIPAIKAVHRQFPEAILSVDTYYAAVAAAAVDAGAAMVNDISGGEMDAGMLETVASLQVPYILMHMKGTPQTMQEHTESSDIVTEVLDYLLSRKKLAEKAGIHDIVVDPGIGFGKTVEQNFQLIRGLTSFKQTGSPVLLGISRKSFIWKTLTVEPDSADCLIGTTALHMVGLQNGASLLRVHDVKEAVQTVTLFTRL